MNLKLIGTLSARPTLSAVLSAKNTLSAALSINRDIETIKDIYKGSYAVEPSAHADQVLQTKSKILDDDIVIKKIQFLEASNDFGGYTATIA